MKSGKATADRRPVEPMPELRSRYAVWPAAGILHGSDPTTLGYGNRTGSEGGTREDKRMVKAVSGYHLLLL